MVPVLPSPSESSVTPGFLLLSALLPPGNKNMLAIHSSRAEEVNLTHT
jgi:hypothetical protein